jgi:large subunit ribosomal protein L28
MARCELTGKRWMNGHKVSHSNIKTKKRWNPNLQKKRVYDVETGRWVTMKLSTSALKSLNKMSLSEYLRRQKKA